MESTINALRNISIKTNKQYHTIIIFIDELDRCLPEYAIKVLKRMHHINQNVPNIQMIYSLDRTQLANTIKNYYGDELNVDRYLKKFISFSLKLLPGEINTNIVKAYPDLFWNFDFVYCTNFNVSKIFSIIFPQMDMRERDCIIKKIIFINNLINQDNKKFDISILFFEIILIMLKCEEVNNLTNLSIDIDHDTRRINLFLSTGIDKLEYMDKFFHKLQNQLSAFNSFQLHVADYPDRNSIEFIVYMFFKTFINQKISECSTQSEVKFYEEAYQILLKFKSYFESITIE